jgi:SAM-dependent methyltransferase
VGFDYELLTCANPWRFVRCPQCSHVWLHPRPAISALATIYPPSYYAYNYAKINPIARRAKEFLDRRKLSQILRWCPQTPKTYLDVGCGDGRFLRTMERLGLARTNLYGLELDAAVVQRLRDAGFSGVSCQRIENATGIPDAGIDFATMFHVIEHVADPAAVLRSLHSRVSPAGVLALETPNIDSFDARLFHRSYWGGYHFPRHWHLFNPVTISRLLMDNGWDVLSILYQTGHSFWMYSLHHWLRYEGLPRPALAAFFDPMKSLFGLASFTAFDLLRGRFGCKTSAMLIIARKIPAA